MPNESFAGYGLELRVAALLLTIYAWKYIIIRTRASLLKKCCVLLAIFALCLPYIYVCIGSMFVEPYGYPPSKWIGSPVWIYGVPLSSFLVCDLNHVFCTPKVFLLRTVLVLGILLQG